MKERENMLYKDVLGDEKEVWFTIRDLKSEGRKFLKWAKSLGCKWINGEKIEPRKGSNFYHLSINSNGVLAYVPMLAWVSPQYTLVKRFDFAKYIKKL